VSQQPFGAHEEDQLSYSKEKTTTKVEQPQQHE
jgi:hypothetical protein